MGTADQRASTPTARRELTRGRILEATRAVAEVRGLRPLTVQLILAQAGVSRRTFYQHFASTDDALRALYQQVVEELLVRIRAAVAATRDPTRRLFAGIDAYLDFQEDGGRLIGLLQAEAVYPESPLYPLREAAVDSLIALLDRQVQAELGISLPALVFRQLFLGMEALVIHLRAGQGLARAERRRVSRVMKPLFLTALANHQSFAERESGEPESGEPESGEPESGERESGESG